MNTYRSLDPLGGLLTTQAVTKGPHTTPGSQSCQHTPHTGLVSLDISCSCAGPSSDCFRGPRGVLQALIKNSSGTEVCLAERGWSWTKRRLETRPGMPGGKCRRAAFKFQIQDVANVLHTSKVQLVTVTHTLINLKNEGPYTIPIAVRNG